MATDKTGKTGAQPTPAKTEPGPGGDKHLLDFPGAVHSHAGYPSDEDLTNRLAAASGQVAPTVAAALPPPSAEGP
jgi:hypothetical protein